MAQVTGAMTLNNGAATPVAKTFAPERVAPDLATFTERSSGVSAGFVRFGVAFSPASVKRPTNRIDLSLDLPTLQSVGGVSSVAYVSRFKGYFVLPDAATAAERADLSAFLRNALAHSWITGLVNNLDPMY